MGYTQVTGFQPEKQYRERKTTHFGESQPLWETASLWLSKLLEILAEKSAFLHKTKYLIAKAHGPDRVLSEMKRNDLSHPLGP